MISYDDILLKNGWSLEHEMGDSGKWFSHPTKGDITIEPEGRWEWTHSNSGVTKGYNQRDLEKALSKGESMTLSQAGKIIENLDSITVQRRTKLIEIFQVKDSVQDKSSGKSGKIQSIPSKDRDKNPIAAWVEWEDGTITYKKVAELKPFGKDAE